MIGLNPLLDMMGEIRENYSQKQSMEQRKCQSLPLFSGLLYPSIYCFMVWMDIPV